MGRSKLDSLKKTTLNTFFEVCEAWGVVSGKHYHFNAGSNIIKFYNKSEIMLKDLFLYPSDRNFDNLGSLEITGAFIGCTLNTTGLQKQGNKNHTENLFSL